MDNEDGKGVVYFKFKDAGTPNIRGVYLACNPSFKQFFLQNETTEKQGLGSTLKLALINQQVKQPYPGQEWFYASHDSVRALQEWFRKEWDGKVVTDTTFEQLKKHVLSFFPLVTSYNKGKEFLMFAPLAGEERMMTFSTELFSII